MWAAHTTTQNLLGNGLRALLKNPNELRRLRENPELATSAVEEFLRYDAPVQIFGRRAKEDIEIEGTVIRRGETVLLCAGAANRDPEQFPDPERLDIGRADNAHVTFGAGIHFCQGASLARLEARVAFNSLLRRLPDLRLADDGEDWAPTVVYRELKTLTVEF
jgi:cytochrome P450